MTKKAYLVGVLLLVGLLFLAACDSEDEKAEETKRNAEITVQLKWSHNPQFAGFYAAERLGYYDKEKLTVTFIPGGPGVDILAPLESGEAQFAIASSDLTISQIANDNKPFQIIGATYQTTPFVFAKLVTEDSPALEGADDWRGLRVMPVDSTILLVGILNSFGLTLEDVEIATTDFDLGKFVSGESADVRGVYITNEILTLQNLGHEVQIFRPEDYGVQSYADVIVTNTEKVEKDIIKRFMRATLQGWQYAVANPDEILGMVLEYTPSADTEAFQSTWEASLPLLEDGKLSLEESVIQSMVSLMVQTGVLTETPDFNQLYTTQYLSQE